MLLPLLLRGLIADNNGSPAGGDATQRELGRVVEGIEGGKSEESTLEEQGERPGTSNEKLGENDIKIGFFLVRSSSLPALSLLLT